MIIDGNILTAEDGMMLTNGSVYSDKVYLGIYDSPDNWTEVPEGDVPDSDESGEEYDESDLAEAARILLGVSE